MPREKIAILGGGVGSLITAWELTATPELRAKYDVTLYQMGWRLGGKGATGRNLDPGKGLRIEEHGLHVWLGFYDNAFQVIQDAYAEVKARGLAPDSPFQQWSDAFKPQSFTPVGVGDGSTWVPVTWPTNPLEPGIHPISALKAIEAALDMLGQLIKMVFGKNPLRALCIGWRLLRIRQAAGKLSSEAALDNEAHLRTIHHHLDAMAAQLRKGAKGNTDPGVIAALVLEMIEMGLACLRGFLNPEYGLLK
ncbi:MAG TPA: NAD(P)-binding protein, partial [Novosphingobium sp.]|nr:NAD(P)-binding protein [Novosphingobium sp.]